MQRGQEKFNQMELALGAADSKLFGNFKFKISIIECSILIRKIRMYISKLVILKQKFMTKLL
jgi:hypothetical protein